MELFPQLARELDQASVRFVLIGVWGANLYARSGATLFTTQDYDLLLPTDAENLLLAWQTCRRRGLELWLGEEPLGNPLDRWLAERVIGQRALVRASDGLGFEVDLTLTMAGFAFEEVWEERRVFLLEGVEVPVARLRHIVESKAAAGRDKDRLFLATHAEALRDLLRED
jgi:hypothetical protein